MKRPSYKQQALLALFLNIATAVIANVYYFIDIPYYLMDITGIFVTVSIIYNFHFMLKENENLKHSENLKTISKHFKILYLLYCGVAMVGLYSYNKNLELENFQVFLTMFYVGILFSGLSLYTFKQDFVLVTIPQRFPLVRFLLRIIILIVVLVLTFGLLNVAFNWGGVISIGVGLVVSGASFFLFLGAIPLWLLFRRIYDKESDKIRYWSLNVLGFAFVLVFAVPLLALPFVISDSNRAFNSSFGDGWDDVTSNTDSHFIESPFRFSSPFFGNQERLVEGEDFKVQSSIVFRNESDFHLFYDIYSPTKKSLENGYGNNQTVIYIHGGGWVSGTRENSQHIHKHLAAQGFVVFAIDYRLTDINLLDASAELGFEPPDVEASDLSYLNGPYQIPDMLDDVAFFTQYLGDLSPSERHWANLNKTTFLGQSAGAYLAAMASFGFNDPYFAGNFSQKISVKNAVLYYPPIFADHFFYGHKAFNNRFQMLNGTPVTNPDLYFHFTPLNLMDEDDPNIMLLHGTLDDLVPIENSEAVNNRAKSLSLSCTFLRVHAIGHGFTNNAQYNRYELYYIERFLHVI